MLHNNVNNNNNNGDVFIYEQMSPELTDTVLQKKIGEMEKKQASLYSQAKDNKDTLWLIRESRVFGMLTVHSAIYDADNDKWNCESPRRFCLTNNGWIMNNFSPNSDEYKQRMLENGGVAMNVTAQNATAFIQTLFEVLNKENFNTEYLLLPDKQQQTKTRGYTGYVKNKVKVNEVPTTLFAGQKQRNELDLPEDIREALSCPISYNLNNQKVLMKDPVVLSRDPLNLLQIGRTFERNELIAFYATKNYQLQEGVDFYPHHKLKAIINYISSTNLEKEEYLQKLAKIAEYEIMNNIGAGDEVIDDAVICETGFSYDKATLQHWIDSRKSNHQPISDPTCNKPIQESNIVPDKNLNAFITAWPQFYTQQQQKSQVYKLEI